MNVLIVTENYFPYGSAMASRILAFCYMFNDLGYSYHVVALHGKNIESFDKNVSFEVVNKNDKNSLETFIGNRDLIDKCKDEINSGNYDLVFAISVHMYFKEILKLCNETNIPMVYEICEWYDKSSYKFGKLDPRFIKFSNNISRNYIKADAIVAISDMLYKHFSSNKNVLRIPSVCDVLSKSSEISSNNEKVNIVFAGSVSKSKELLKPILEALCKKEFKEKIHFDIYGINESQLLNNIDNDDALLKDVSCSLDVHGFVEQSKIEDILRKSDYQIFIRPNRCSSNAGFPTKLCESMSVGTPVITNNTGDICLYLKDGINGFVCRDNSTEAIEEAFERVLCLKKDEYNKLRLNARKTAEDNFDYRVYSSEIDRLFNGLIIEKHKI